jgi:hypothetical protein
MLELAMFELGKYCLERLLLASQNLKRRGKDDLRSKKAHASPMEVGVQHLTT